MGSKQPQSPPVQASPFPFQHLEMLGYRVKDKVTGLTGVVTSMTFDLYGCIQAIVCPPVTEEGKRPDSVYFDVNRLKVLDRTPVMEQPDFVTGRVAAGNHGPADKPLL